MFYQNKGWGVRNNININNVVCFLIIVLFVVYFILIKCTNKSSKDKSFVEKENDEEIVILVKDLIEDDESITEKKVEIDRIKFNKTYY